jgi:hypothetical protein
MTQEQLNNIWQNLIKENKRSAVIDDPRNEMSNLIVTVIANEDTKQELMITKPDNTIKPFSDFDDNTTENVTVGYWRIRGSKEENWADWAA